MVRRTRHRTRAMETVADLQTSVVAAVAAAEVTGIAVAVAAVVVVGVPHSS